MAGALIPFRNGSLDLEIRDHGYEYDTGAHEIEWTAVGYYPTEEWALANIQEGPFDPASITDKESEYIDSMVRTIALDMRND